MSNGPVTIFGGSGFLGRRIVERLSAAAIPVRIATRRPQATGGAEALGGRRQGSIEWRRADIRDGASVAAAVAGARGVVNAVSLYTESGGQTFRSIHVEGARNVALHARSAGVPILLHVSGLGADATSPSPYIRCRGEGEAVVREGFGNPTIFRPSVMFGVDDAFLNELARVVTLFPVVPLFGDGATKLQPVWVGDIAAAAARLFDGVYERSEIYALGGPRVYSYREIIELIAARLGKRRILAPVPFEAWRLAATAGRFLPGFPVSGPQVDLMRQDNVVGSGFPTLAQLNIDPKPLEEVLDGIVGKRRETHTRA
jgi:NADH dehydrogenase